MPIGEVKPKRAEVALRARQDKDTVAEKLLIDIMELEFNGFKGIEGLKREVREQMNLGVPMLKKAIESGDLKAVQFMIYEVGHRVYYCDPEGKTAYDYAYDLEDGELRQWLVNEEGVMLPDNSASDPKTDDRKEKGPQHYEQHFSPKQRIDLSILDFEFSEGFINENMYFAQVKINGLDSIEAAQHFIMIKSVLTEENKGRGWAHSLKDRSHNSFHPEPLVQLRTHFKPAPIARSFRFFKHSKDYYAGLANHLQTCIGEMSRDKYGSQEDFDRDRESLERIVQCLRGQHEKEHENDMSAVDDNQFIPSKL